MSQTCFCPEEAAYCESLVDVWVWSHDEAMHMPEPGCQRLVDVEDNLRGLFLDFDEDGKPQWFQLCPWLNNDGDDDMPF